MAETTATARDGRATVPVSQLDWWKAAALLLVLVDHYGHFIDTEENFWRAIGRASLPIWFFLIGYGGGRRIPWTWWAFGAVLTALDIWSSEDWTDAQVNILISFGLMRLALPWIETHILGSPVRLALFCGFLAAINPWTDQVIEYGSHGWLLMLAGALHRRWQETGSTEERYKRLAVAAFGTVAFMVKETLDYEFEDSDLWLMIALTVLVAVLLVFARRGVSAVQPPRPISDVVRFLGRHTLELYAAHVGLLMIATGLFDIGD